jgi:phosphonate transport system substrate-binding protein
MRHFAHRRATIFGLLAACCAPQRAWSATTTDLEIGILPNISTQVLLAQYQPLRDFLQRRLGRGIQISTAPSWSVFHQRTMALEYDLVVTASHVARLAQLEKGFVPLVVYEPPIKGMIAFAKDRPIGTIGDIKGQTLVLSNPKSLVTLRGLQWLEEKGLKRTRDFKTINTPTDDSVGNVVVHHDAIAAMLSGGEYRAIPSAIKEQIQILTTFAEVPGFVVLANPRMSADLAQSIKTEWLNFSNGAPEGQAFFTATGFTAMRELPPGLMASMDPYVAATRALMAEPG